MNRNRTAEQKKKLAMNESNNKQEQFILINDSFMNVNVVPARARSVGKVSRKIPRPRLINIY